MKIYLLAQSLSYVEAAQFAVVGTWSEPQNPCEVCTATGERLVAPLQLEWELGSGDIADFAWDGGYVCAVQSKVKRFFREQGFKCQFLGVEHVPPSTPVRKRQKIVSVPYKGPKLFWLRTNVFIDLNEEKSEVRIKSACPTCGRIRKTFRRTGIVIDAKSWRSCHLFRISQNGQSSATFVTHEARDLILSAGFTNVEFREAGRVE